MRHLALEKALKALVTEETGKLPPRTHNLIDLARRVHLDPPQEYRDFIGKITDASVITRYPDDWSQVVSQYTESVARDYMEKTKEVIAWIRRDPRLLTS